MKRSQPGQSNLSFVATAILSMLVWVGSSGGQTITWQVLPFPTNSVWGGTPPQPAITNANSVVLKGEPARTVQTFTVPFTVTCDFKLASRLANDGQLTLSLLPPGQPTNSSTTAGLVLDIVYSNNHQYNSYDRLEIQQLSNGANLWSNMTFSVVGGTTYHLELQVSALGALSLNIDGTPYAIPGSIVYPYAQSQLEINGWQPSNAWTVSNFAVVPEPTTVALVGTSLAGLLTLFRRRRQSAS